MPQVWLLPVLTARKRRPPATGTGTTRWVVVFMRWLGGWPGRGCDLTPRPQQHAKHENRQSHNEHHNPGSTASSPQLRRRWQDAGDVAATLAAKGVEFTRAFGLDVLLAVSCREAGARW